MTAGGKCLLALGVLLSVTRSAVAQDSLIPVRRDAQELRVVVTEGKVRLDSPPGADGRATPVSLLPAGSVATAGRDGVLVRSLPVAEAERYLEWRSGFLTFDDATLAAAAAEFNRFNTRNLELADAGVGVDLQPRLNVGDDGLVVHPGADLAAPPIGAQHRHDQIGCRLVQHLRAVVAGARHERLLEPRLAQHFHRLGRRQHVPGVMAVVDVRVDQRTLILGGGEGGAPDSQQDCWHDGLHRPHWISPRSDSP